jgi:hypothetical protein
MDTHTLPLHSPPPPVPALNIYESLCCVRLAINVPVVYMVPYVVVLRGGLSMTRAISGGGGGRPKN